MRTHTGHGHRHAVTILEGEYRAEWEELLDVLGTVEPPLGPDEPYSSTSRPKRPKRQLVKLHGRKANVLMPVAQKELNKLIKSDLRKLGWRREPYILDRHGDPIDNRQRGDFEKSGVFVEVEFGNVASFYRDLFKFHLAGTTGAAEVGIVVVATSGLARFFDQGVATYELALERLPHLRSSLHLPIAVVGLDVADWSSIRRRYDSMRRVAESHGDECHPFEDVFQARPEDLPPGEEEPA
jgi:hypothetical protein